MASRNTFQLGEFVGIARKTGTDTRLVEVKEAAGGLPKSIAETVSAFANGSGGVIVCGLSEKNGFVPAPGFDAARVSDALAQACADRVEPPVRAEITLEEFEGSPVVWAYIPEMDPYLKPCYVKSRTMLDGAFVRMADGDHRLSRYEVSRIVEGQHQPEHDRRVVEGAALHHLDPLMVEGFLKRVRSESAPAIKSLGDEDLLCAMGVAIRDEAGGLRPTVAGIMALGVFPQQFFPAANVTFLLVPGFSKADVAPGRERFVDSKNFDGSIPYMVCEAMARIRRNMRTASRVEGAFRYEVPEYPEVAVREALVNALVHRDYSPEGLGSQVQVNMYEDRLEIMNPGGLFGTMTIDKLGKLGESSRRNRTLARILEFTAYPQNYAEQGFVVENKGTGYYQIQSSLAQASMSPPVPQDVISSFVLTMKRRQELVSDRFARGGAGASGDRGAFDGAGAGACAGKGDQGEWSGGQSGCPGECGGVRDGRAGRPADGLNGQGRLQSDRDVQAGARHVPFRSRTEYAIIEFMAQEEGPVGASRIAAAVGKSKATVNRAINSLLNSGSIERLGGARGPGVSYRLVR